MHAPINISKKLFRMKWWWPNTGVIWTPYFITWWWWWPDNWEVQREQVLWIGRRQVQEGLASGQGQCCRANSMHMFLLGAFDGQRNGPPSSLPYHQQAATLRTPYVRLKSPRTNDWVRNNRWESAWCHVCQLHSQYLQNNDSSLSRLDRHKINVACFEYGEMPLSDIGKGTDNHGCCYCQLIVRTNKKSGYSLGGVFSVFPNK